VDPERRDVLNQEQSDRVAASLAIAGGVARRWVRRTGFEYDGLFSAACLGLCKAALSWDGMRSWETWAWICADGWALTEVKILIRNRKRYSRLSDDSQIAIRTRFSGE
jgi:DNA-directed RNA polymerase specialized sigma subunit